jgi:hypothetical protein
MAKSDSKSRLISDRERMIKASEPLRSGEAETDGFIVVRIHGHGPSMYTRWIHATGFANDDLVAEASAADNYAENVISSSTQSFTMPLRKGDKWRVEIDGGGDFQIRWIGM